MPSDNRLVLVQEVERAIDLCRAGRWQQGRDALARLSRLVTRHHRLPAEYYAYLGYCVARFDHRLTEGMRICEHAIALDPENAEAHLSLARIHKLANRRQQGIRALQKGLEFDPESIDLHDLHLEYGVRRRPVIPFLSRHNPLNTLFGRWRHHLMGSDGYES